MTKTNSNRWKNFQSRALTGFVRSGLNTLSYVAPTRAGELAFKIFARPRKGQLTEKDKSYLDKSIQKKFLIENIEIATYCFEPSDANAPTILLAHGWESNSARWRVLAQLLQKQGFRVVMLDAPAHGGSGNRYFNVPLYGKMMRDVMQHFQPNFLVGHSAGAMAVAYFLSHFPSDTGGGLRKVVLMASPADLVGLFDYFQNLVGFNQKIRRELDAIVYRLDGNQTDYYSVENFVSKIDISFRKNLDCLFIHDTEDAVSPLRHSEKSHTIWEGSELFVTQNLGHSLQHRSVYERILKFLA